MTAKRRSARIAAIVLPLLLALSALVPVAGVVAQDPGATPAATPFASAMTADEAIAAATLSDGLLRFEVSENALLFVFDPDLVHDDGMPAYGATFITRAYIYPAGTLTDSNGVNADGSPEFPDQVLGEWYCRGWFIADGMHTTSGPFLMTTQVYSFGGLAGAATLVSDGYELADVGVTIERAVTGGTGPFAGAGGVAHQTLLGLNATQGVNLQFEISLQS